MHSQCCTTRHDVQNFFINFNSHYHIAFQGGGRILHSPQQGDGLRLLKHGASVIPSFNKYLGQRPQAMQCSRRWKCNSGHYSLCPHGDSRLKKKINHIRQRSAQDEGMSDEGDYFGTGVSANFFPLPTLFSKPFPAISQLFDPSSSKSWKIPSCNSMLHSPVTSDRIFKCFKMLDFLLCELPLTYTAYLYFCC